MAGPLVVEGPSVVVASGVLNPGFALAGLLSLITFGVHTFVGGIFVARPLLKARDLTPASRWLNYYTWHMATVMLLFMAAGFVWAALLPDAIEIAFLLTAMAAVFSALCVWVAIKGGIAPWRFPAAWLFLIIAVVGGFSVVEYAGSSLNLYAERGVDVTVNR
jgi:hypothetical protein